MRAWASSGSSELQVPTVGTLLMSGSGIRQDSLTAYRTGELVKEAIAFERKLGLKTTREAYPLIYQGTS